MRKFGYPVAPMVLASVLAQMLETSLQQSLLISQGSAMIFVTRPSPQSSWGWRSFPLFEHMGSVQNPCS